MKWAKRSDYHAVSDCGGYKIAVWCVNGEPAYLLTHQGRTLGWYDTSREAQRAAKEHKGE